MRLAFTTLGTPEWTLERVADAAKAYGYDGVELRLIDGDVITASNIAANRERMRRVFGQSGIEVVAFASSASFSNGDPAVQAASREDCKAVIALAADLKVPLIRVFGGKLKEGVSIQEGAANVAAGLNAVAPAAEAAGVTVMLETHDDFCSSAVVAGIMRQVPSRAVGVHWDVQNTHKLRESIRQAWDALGDRVVHVHVKDAVRGPEPRPRVLLGEGEVPVREAVALLMSVGYAGYLSVEMEKKWYPDQPDPDVFLPQYSAGLRGYLG